MAGRQWLGVGDIERRAADVAAVERRQQRVIVDEAAPGDVDDVLAGLGQRQSPGIDEVAGMLGQRCGEHDMVGGGEQCVGIDAGDAGGGERRVSAAGGDDIHAECLGAGCQRLGDRSETDDAQRRAGDGGERRRRPAIGAVDPDFGQALGVGEDRRQREFGECDR